MNWAKPSSRHPLHEQILDTFVANDARLVGGAGLGVTLELPEDGEEWNSVLLCTGANACGKVGCRSSSSLHDADQLECLYETGGSTGDRNSLLHGSSVCFRLL